MKSPDDLKQQIKNCILENFESRMVYGKTEIMLCCLESELPQIIDDLASIMKNSNINTLLEWYNETDKKPKS